MKPLAIGLLQHPPGVSPAARRQARISLTAQAPRHGFAIAEVYELDGNPVADDAAVGALLRLAARTAARTVLTAGPLDRDRAADLARHRHLHLVPTDLHLGARDRAGALVRGLHELGDAPQPLPPVRTVSQAPIFVFPRRTV